MSSFREVANKCGLDDKTTERFIKYMKLRWGSTEESVCEHGYAEEWAIRFKDKQEWIMSDKEGRRLLLEL